MRLRDYINVLEIKCKEEQICATYNICNTEYQLYIHSSTSAPEHKVVEAYIKYIPNLGWRVDVDREIRIGELMLSFKD